jgi:hypothetical protein
MRSLNVSLKMAATADLDVLFPLIQEFNQSNSPARRVYEKCGFGDHSRVAMMKLLASGADGVLR